MNITDVKFENSVFAVGKNPQDVVILIRCSTLKRKSNEKKGEIKILKEFLKVLEGKRKYFQS